VGRKNRNQVARTCARSRESIMTTTRKKKETANVPSGGWPKMNQGTHLTVKTFEDGRTELIWDDAALLAEVKDAILKYESTIPVETKTTKRKGKTK
jgi:hypothetical protein